MHLEILSISKDIGVRNFSRLNLNRNVPKPGYTGTQGIEIGKKLTYYRGLIFISKKEEDFLRRYIDNLLSRGLIRPLKLLISYRVLFTTKKNSLDPRPYINYRKLNDVTRKNRYLLLRIDKL